MESVKLCPCNSSGCPTVEKSDGKIKIKDDFGGEVVLTIEEALLIQNALDELDITYKCP
jgi:hypothetical protein